ncbi:hypothetical protein KA005_48095 [bacterium]|nr:hypothetical protein [bacterium]
MKLLILHCREFGFELGKKGRLAEEVEEESCSCGECVIAFVCVEKEDGAGKVPDAVREITGIAEKVAAKEIIVFPFAHLSNELAGPEDARRIARDIYEGIEGYSKKWVPFGWFKVWSMRSMGHSLASNFRSL